MRDLKFRAWDKNSKYMEDDFLMSSNGEAGYLEHTSGDAGTFDYFEENNNLIVMQYTGLKDKNGKEIYEGDIFKKDNTVGDIRWNNKSMCYNMYYSYMGDKVVDSLRGYEIIGNIYENPEILGIQ